MIRLKPTNVDDYLASFSDEAVQRMKALRKLIVSLSPLISESISYRMPAYKYKNKPLVYYAAYSKHIGVYATPVSHKAFQSELKKYKQGKGSVQFPLEEEMPMDLIERMIHYRLQVIHKTGK